MTGKAKEIFLEIHSGIPKEGPGDRESTKRAFSLITGLPPHPRLLDIGCGPGRQTLDLASVTDGEIVAVDAQRPYLLALEEKAGRLGLGGRIRAVQMDMNALDFPEASFNVIWAEGSIYIIGFENGLRRWKPLLKAGGWLAATEISWLKSDPPDEAQMFWSQAYPAMQGVEGNLKIIERCGYEVIDHFALPESAWWEDYYDPIEQKLAALREKYKSDGQALAIIEAEQSEIDLYRKYSDFYGYVFYILRALPQ